MAVIRPLRGLRYAQDVAGDSAELLAPPYDVIDAEARSELAARSPANCVRLILPEGEGDTKYANAAARFRAQIGSEIVRDDEPGYYVYHQEFEAEGRTYTRKGFVCAIELTPFGAGPVRPHERTLSGPKADRLALMAACDAHLELVFGMFSDPAREWESAVHGALGSAVLDCEFDGTRHRLFRVHDEQTCHRLSEVLADKAIYIADGHHRYETMCAYAKQSATRDDRPSRKFGMIFLSNLDDPGLVVLPTHRAVHSLPALDLDAALDGLSRFFTIERGPLPDSAADLRARLMAAGEERAAFGLARPGSQEWAVLVLRPDFDPRAAGLGELHPALQRLDVAVLHELVLEASLGIDKAAQAAKTNLRYERSTEHALEWARTRGGDTQLICFMNATPVSDVVAVCDSGQVMPQKSTFFHPKIPTGLVFHDLSSD